MLFGSSWNMGAEKKRWHPRGSWEKEAGHRLRAQAEGWNWGRGAGNGRDGALLEVQLSDALGSWRAGATAEANTYRLLRYQMCSHESRKKVRRKAWKFIRHTEGKVLKMGKYQSPQNKEPKWKPIVPRSTVPTASKQDIFSPLLSDPACLLHVCAQDSVLCSDHSHSMWATWKLILTSWHLGSCASHSHCGYSRKKSRSLHWWACLFLNDFCGGRGGSVLSANPGVCIGQKLLFWGK